MSQSWSGLYDFPKWQYQWWRWGSSDEHDKYKRGQDLGENSRPGSQELWPPSALRLSVNLSGGGLPPPHHHQCTFPSLLVEWLPVGRLARPWLGRRDPGNQSARVMEPEPLARSHIYYRSTRPIDCHSLAPTYISNKYNLVNYTNTGRQQATRLNQSRL